MNNVKEIQPQTNELRAADQPVVVTAAQMQVMTVGQLTEIEKTLRPIVEAGNFVIDCSTKDGYEKSRKFYLNQCRPLKSTITTTHKALKNPLLATTKMLDAERARLLAKLDSIGKPHHDAYRARDIEVEQEKNRIAGLIQQAHNLLLQYESRAVGGDVDLIQSFIDDLADGEIDTNVFNTAKVREEYSSAVRLTIGKLTALKQAAKDRATVAKIEAEKAEQERIENEAKAEHQRIEAAKAQAAADKLEADNKAKQDLIYRQQAEMEKMKALLQAQKDKEAQAKRDADMARQLELNAIAESDRLKQIEEASKKKEQEKATLMMEAENETADQMVALIGVSKAEAKVFITRIQRGQVPHLTFSI